MSFCPRTYINNNNTNKNISYTERYQQKNTHSSVPNQQVQPQPRISQQSQKAHNLNVAMYSFDEILGLFDLSYDITMDEMKRAKKKVLMTHPDKSNLPPDYFLFYKKAYEIVFNYYQENNKQSQTANPQNTVYKKYEFNNYNRSTNEKINQSIQQISPKDFNEKFNDLFDKHMVTKKNNEKNAWFTKDESVFSVDEPVNKTNMNQTIENMKKQSQGMILYKGVQDYISTPSNLSSCYDDDDDDEAGTYISSDPFSKLKFDDLRKVHREQTIFSVSERDYENVTKYKSTDEYARARSQQSLTPLERDHAEQILMEQQRILKEKMARKNYESNLRTQEYSEKNKAVISTFLQLKN